MPSRGKGDPSYRNTYDKDGVTETVELAAPLERYLLDYT